MEFAEWVQAASLAVTFACVVASPFVGRGWRRGRTGASRTKKNENPVLVIRGGERMLFKDDILISETPSPMMLIDDNGWKEGK